MYNPAVQLLARRTMNALNFSLDPELNFFPPKDERFHMYPYWLDNVPCQMLLFIVPLYVALLLLRGIRSGCVKTILIITFWHCVAIFPMYIGFFFGRHESSVRQEVAANALLFSLQFALLINGCIAIIALGFESCPNTGTFWTFKSMGYCLLFAPSLVAIFVSLMFVVYAHEVFNMILIGQFVILVLVMIRMFFRTPSILYNLEHLIFILLLEIHPVLIAIYPEAYSLKLSQCFYVCIVICARFILEPFMKANPIMSRRCSISSESSA